jgi:hypothetical protein
MVNKVMVNAPEVRRKHAYFFEFLLVFARFLRFKKPVKYNTMFEINQDCAPAFARLPLYINTLAA